jgi:hypothetical protein
MTVTQEFVVIPIEGGVRIHGVPDWPPGTVTGPNALKLHVEGPVWVRQPRTELAQAQWEKWQVLLKEAGWSVTIEPLWTGKAFEDLDPEDLVPWEDFRDELLRSARQGSDADDRGVAAAAGRNPSDPPAHG